MVLLVIVSRKGLNFQEINYKQFHGNSKALANNSKGKLEALANNFKGKFRTFANKFKKNPLTPGTLRRCRKNKYRSLRWYR